MRVGPYELLKWHRPPDLPVSEGGELWVLTANDNTATYDVVVFERWEDIDQDFLIGVSRWAYLV